MNDAIANSLDSTGLAELVLDAMGLQLGLSITVICDSRRGVGDMWRLEAVDINGDLWVTAHEDYYTAASMLAELLGFEPRES